MTTTTDILLCYRARRDVNRRRLRAHWRDKRLALLHRLQGDLGFSACSHLHRSSRLNPLYLGIRATRSWPSAALFSLIRGRALPPFFPQNGGADERWDVVEALTYPSLEAARAALATESGGTALAALRDDAEPFVRNGAAVVTHRLSVTEDDGLQFPRTVTMFLLRSRSPMDDRAMLDYWQSEHKALVESLTTAMGHRTYCQLHVAPEDNGRAGILGAFGGRLPDPYAGIAYLAYGSQWDLLWRLVDPRLHVANVRLVKDEVGFIDLGASALVFGSEERL